MKFIDFENPQVRNARHAFDTAQARLARLEATGESYLRSGQFPAMFAREWDQACSDFRRARRNYHLAQQDS